MATPTPTTQERHPWRTVVRTTFQLIVGLCALVPLVVLEIDSPSATLGAVVGVAATVTRIMALTEVEVFLQEHFPWLSAEGRNDA